MSREQEQLADKDPTSLSIPLAYSQPTLPPPPVEANDVGPTWSVRWGSRLVGAGLVAVAGLTAAAYTLLPHGSTRETAAATAPVTVTAQLDQLVHAFPEQLPERTCSESADRIPLVLYSGITGLETGVAPSEAEHRLFAGAVTVTDPTLTTTARRVAVLRTMDLKEPQPSLGEPTPGRYEGALVVFDTATGTPLCHTIVRTWSSSEIAQPKISARVLNDDFVQRARGAIAEGASRLHVVLDL